MTLKNCLTGIVECLEKKCQDPEMQPGSKGNFHIRLRKVLPGFCQKFWSNFDSNFPNDDIVHTAESDVPDVSQNFFSTEYSSYWDFPSISEIIRIFPEYLWQADPPGTLSKLWHSYPGANSNQLPNNKNLFWKVLNQSIRELAVVGGVGVKLLPFSFDLCQPQYFFRRRNMKGQIYTLATFNCQEVIRRSDFVDNLKLSGNFWELQYLTILQHVFHTSYL